MEPTSAEILNCPRKKSGSPCCWLPAGPVSCCVRSLLRRLGCGLSMDQMLQVVLSCAHPTMRRQLTSTVWSQLLLYWKQWERLTVVSLSKNSQTRQSLAVCIDWLYDTLWIWNQPQSTCRVLMKVLDLQRNMSMSTSFTDPLNLIFNKSCAHVQLRQLCNFQHTDNWYVLASRSRSWKKQDI